MHFEFSESTHQWCCQCGGNIRKDAPWCRFCRKHIASKFLRDGRGLCPSGIIDATARWLPQFNDLILRCGPELQERFRQADLDTAQSFRQSDREYLAQCIAERSSTLCYEFPPDARAIGLVQDILLNFNQRAVELESLCAEPRLVLIEVTAASIIKEGDLRLLEESDGEQCKFCHEFTLRTAECCRFCTAKGGEPPEHESNLGMAKLDQEFLASVLLWEAARVQLESQPSLPPIVLASYCVTDDDIETEISRQSSDLGRFPRSPWRTKILQLNLKTKRSFEETEIQDLLDLGSACSSQDKNLEAEIVFKHGLRRLKNGDSHGFAKSQMISGLSIVYMALKDYEQHHRLKEEALQVRLSALPENRRQQAIKFEQAKDSMLMRLTVPNNLDPKQAVEQAQARLKKSQEKAAEMIEQASSPEIRKFHEELKSRIDRVAGVGSEIAKLRIAAAEERNKGDFARACELLELAISKLGSDARDVATRSRCVSFLAKLQWSDGKPDLADNTHRQAIAIAEELEELYDGSEYAPLRDACSEYARFLMHLERYEEAEQKLIKALELDRKYEAKCPLSGNGDGTVRPSYIEPGIRTELAKVLRKTGRIAQAEEEEAQAADIKKRLEENEQRIANNRRNYLEMVSDDKLAEDP